MRRCRSTLDTTTQVGYIWKQKSYFHKSKSRALSVLCEPSKIIRSESSYQLALLYTLRFPFLGVNLSLGPKQVSNAKRCTQQDHTPTCM